MMSKIYPRKGDTQTVYLNAVVKDPSIPFTMILFQTRVCLSKTMCCITIRLTTNG